MKRLDEKERLLIKSLRENGRLQVNAVAKAYGFPISTMAAVFHRLQRDGILKHGAFVNFQALGYPIRKVALIKTRRDCRDRMRDYLKQADQVNTLHEINSGFDFMIETVFANNKEGHEFLERLAQEQVVLEMNVHDVIDTVHQERFLSEDRHFD
ncbi:MAG: Lrp/AsnC family transcriptional regulator [Candidatus Woesearchaeota archaeon]|nr:MAG: Lrp/AsnC family transcriptional regulator [Candidatus Woesearchaeota archaeon]